MEKPSPEKKDKRLSAIGTTLFSGVLLTLCFILGLSVPLPLPEEQGVEVSLGDSDNGFGRQTDQTPASPVQTDASEPVTQSSQNPNDISMQSTEDCIRLENKPKDKPKNEKQRQKPQQDTESEKPSFNPNASYGGRRTSSDDGIGKGDTEGNSGKGNTGGDSNSNCDDGVPGRGGVSFNLNGRSSSNLVKPVYSSKDQGTVAVKIWVDRKGNVIKAQAGERGTTVSDHRLYEMAEQAALKSLFNPDPNASDVQIGTITYKFQIGGM